MEIIYFLLYVIILIYVYEYWKSIKITKIETFQNKKNNIESGKESENDDSMILSEESINYKPSFAKYGFIPSDYADYSNYTLNPEITRINKIKDESSKNNKSNEEINNELNEQQNNKILSSIYAPNYVSDPHYNTNLDIPLTDKYYKNRRYIPQYWKCQRHWFECHSHLPWHT